jgi:ABC-type branched-subunit amino acid transport system substrate-binding protein
VVIGSGNVGARVIATVLESEREVQLFVGSGLRSRLLNELVESGAPDVLEGVEGVSPRAEGETEFEAALQANDPAAPTAPTAYAAHAYDCVNLMALASERAGGDDGLAAAALLREVSEIGSPCESFPECVRLIADGRDVDLEGASGSIGLDDNGDVTEAVYDHFQYMSDGRDRTRGSYTVTVPVT